MLILSFAILLITTTHSYPQETLPKIVGEKIHYEVRHIFEGDNNEPINPIEKDGGIKFRPYIPEKTNGDNDGQGDGSFSISGYKSEMDLVDTQRNLKKGISNKSGQDGIFSTKPDDDDSKVNLYVTINTGPFATISLLDLGDSRLLRLLSQKSHLKSGNDA